MDGNVARKLKAKVKIKAKFRRKLVMYSGGQNKSNELLHEAFMTMKKGKRAKSLTYIPYSHDNGEFYFKRIKRRYKSFGIKKFVYFAVDSDFMVKEMNKALKSDVIYLAGGNTFYFLKHLRESGFMQKLIRYVRNGGVVAGLSAGALVMTKHIFLAGYPKHEGDANEVRLKNLKALGLVDFEFLPHYIPSAQTHRALLRYSRRNKRMIIACPDGSGVVLNGTETRLVGPVYFYFKGQRVKLA